MPTFAVPILGLTTPALSTIALATIALATLGMLILWALAVMTRVGIPPRLVPGLATGLTRRCLMRLGMLIVGGPT